jgi:glycosyltransferase involved in cell wall biosynthesis
MRIVQLLAPASFGGLERVVTQLCRGLSGRGHDPIAGLLVEAEQVEEPGLAAALVATGITVHLLRTPHRAYQRERMMVRDLLRTVRPEVVHTHGYHADVLLRSVAQQLDIPVVATVHGFTGGGLKNRVFEWLQRRSLRRMDNVIAVSNPMAQWLASSGVSPSRLRMIRNAYQPPGEFLSRKEARGALGVAAEAKLIGWVGRITPEKGPDLMVEAFSRCRTEGVELAMVGRGRLQPTLEQRVDHLGLNPRVHWSGAVPDAWRLFRAFDVYCLSSHTEGTPMALFEAMAAEVPIVTTAVGGIPDVVSQREALLAPAGDAAALARCLDQALQDNTRERVRAAADRLHREFGVDSWLDQYEAVYRSLASKVNP